MHEAAKRIPKYPAHDILEGNPCPHEPPIPRVREGQQPQAASRRRLEQWSVGRVATHDAIHRHHVGRLEIWYDGDEVAVHQLESVSKTAPRRLVARRRHVGRCGLHDRCPFGSGRQQLEAERPDTRPHIEYRSPVPCPENGISQHAGRRIEPAVPVVREVAPGRGVTEVTLVGGPEGSAARARSQKVASAIGRSCRGSYPKRITCPSGSSTCISYAQG